MQQTLIEKIAQKFAVGLEPEQIVKSGDIISIKSASMCLQGCISKKESEYKIDLTF